LIFKFTVGYPDGFHWKLALNIHASDGHNFGYGADVWDHNVDVGTEAAAFTADYKSYRVTLETANSIAIVRHQNGMCEAARVWEFLEEGKTLYDYFDLNQTNRLVATKAHWTSSYTSPTMVDKDKDPIFAVDGALVFNWWSRDGTRIGISKAYCSGNNLPAEDENINNFMGLGNEQGGSANGIRLGEESAALWCDVGIQDCNMNRLSRAQGSDHGTSFSDGTLYGQYAVYVSDAAKTFPCKGIKIQTSMYDWSLDFYRIDKHGNHKLNFLEFELDKADNDKDGVLTFLEYSDARSERRFVETAEVDVHADFDRIDKNSDYMLSYYEIEFDIADYDKDGVLTLLEYSEARSERIFEETAEVDVHADFDRIDKNRDNVLSYDEIEFDTADTNEDGSLTFAEYYAARAENTVVETESK